MKKSSTDIENIIDYTDAIRQIKQAILSSRYNAATLANQELLKLYFTVGEFVSTNTRNKNWGKGAIEIISNRLQQELTGLRGFSATNLKNMRIFYEKWKEYIPIYSLINPIGNIERDTYSEIRQLPSDDLAVPKKTQYSNRQLITVEITHQDLINRQLPSDDLNRQKLENFFKIGFSHHLLILYKVTSLQERMFYIDKCVEGFWSVDRLKYNITNDLFSKTGTLINNFEKTIENDTFRKNAINTFKDELLLDFINITDPDEESDERVLEHAIVNNIKKFIMALGADFSFIGNQYRLIVDQEDFFIDLLFFNRKAQSLVAIELKKGKFKSEYVGKMNFYLSALDDLVKQPHENPSIGIILCKEKNNKIVEYALRDTAKPMGVAIYKTSKELPEKYRNILPNAEELKLLL